MKRILIASLALALGLHTASAQSNRVLNLEGAPYEVPFLDFSTNGVWLGATGFSSSHFSPRGVKIWNLLTGDTSLFPPIQNIG